MKLNSARVLGFQSFGDSGRSRIRRWHQSYCRSEQRGQERLLRALQPALSDDRHRTPDKWATHQLAASTVHVTISLRGDEIRDGILRFGQQRIPTHFPATDPPAFLLDYGNYRRSSSNSYAFLEVIFLLPPTRLTVFFEIIQGNSQACIIAMPTSGDVVNGGIQYTNEDTMPSLASSLWREDMFFFTAERFALGECGHGYATRLTSNADNLPIVLHTLNGTRGTVYRKLVAHLRDIFPTVGNLSVGPTPNGNLEVRVWPTEVMDRVELSFPLNSSGTGVSQVIALLTAIMTVDNAVLIIDEISSFLHPAAVKALLRILQTEYAHHQYIISTHAPEVIGFSNPRMVHLVKRDGYESSVTQLNLMQVDAFRAVAENLGVSMADVFAADRVVWVEGPTEELCFPLLYQQATGQPLPRGTIFTSVMATGDFFAKRRDRELVYQIYQRLSQVAVPLVVAVAFSFDSENLTDAEKENMIRDSRGAMHFLPRRLIECYLVNPDAIAAFIADRDSEPARIDAGMAAAKLVELAGADKFRITEWSGDLTNPAWLTKVDAANLIADTCALLSSIGSLSTRRTTR